MQLYRWRGAVRNFGDELNSVLWPLLLPNFFDGDPAELFLGIGSVLDARHDATAVKLVAGAGYGGYQAPPVLDASWIVHWVRGPRTARLLGLPESCGLGDPAMLLTSPGDGGAGALGFMPHFESLARGAWAEATAAAGITLIDPRGDPAAILAAIGNCRHAAQRGDARRHRRRRDARAVGRAAAPGAGASREMARLGRFPGPPGALPQARCLVAARAAARIAACIVTPRSPRCWIAQEASWPAPPGDGSSSAPPDPWPRPPWRRRSFPPRRLWTAAVPRMLERLDALRRNPRHPAASTLRPPGSSAYHG